MMNSDKVEWRENRNQTALFSGQTREIGEREIEKRGSDNGVWMRRMMDSIRRRMDDQRFKENCGSDILTG